MFGNTCMKTCVNKCISNSKLYVLEKNTTLLSKNIIIYINRILNGNTSYSALYYCEHSIELYDEYTRVAAAKLLLCIKQKGK